MEWSGLGDLLGRSLSGGLNTYGDIALQRKAQQQEFEQKKQMMQEQEAIKQKQAMAQQAEKQKKAQIFGDLISGRNPFQDQGIPNQGQMPDIQQIPPQGMMPQQGGMQQPMQQREPSIDEITQYAVQAGLSPQEIGVIQRNYEKKKSNELAEKKLQWQMDKAESADRLRREAPQRKELSEKISSAKTRVQGLRKQEQDYKILDQIIKSGKVRQGTPRQLMNALGIAEWGQNPETELASKIIENISLAQTQSMTGLGTLTGPKLLSLQKSNPNLFMAPRGLLGASRVNRLTAKADRIYDEKLIELEDKYIKKGEEIPLNIEQMASRQVHDKIEQIHKKQSDTVFILGLPNPMQLKNKYKIDKDTGRVYKSDGSEWRYETTLNEEEG